MHCFFLMRCWRRTRTRRSCPGEEQHHLVSVLEICPGDRAVLTDPCERYAKRRSQYDGLRNAVQDYRTDAAGKPGVSLTRPYHLFRASGEEVGSIQEGIAGFRVRTVFISEYKSSGRPKRFEKRQRLQRIAVEAASGVLGRRSAPEARTTVPLLEEAFDPSMVLACAVQEMKIISV